MKRALIAGLIATAAFVSNAWACGETTTDPTAPRARCGPAPLPSPMAVYRQSLIDTVLRTAQLPRSLRQQGMGGEVTAKVQVNPNIEDSVISIVRTSGNSQIDQALVSAIQLSLKELGPPSGNLVTEITARFSVGN